MTTSKDQGGHSHQAGNHCHCCPDSAWHKELALSRRGFMATAAMGGAVLGGMSWASMAQGAEDDLPMPKARQALKVFPVLVWDNPQRAPMTSWRSWGGIASPQEAAEEVARIEGELAKIAKAADFPVEFAKVASVNNADAVKDAAELKAADVVIVYGAGIAIDACKDFGKDVIVFQRHRSGPVYLQYEVISPRFLRQHTDKAAIPHIAFDDIVTDSLDEIVWRLRSLCGLKNTRSTKIMCIGGPAAWAQPEGVVPALVKKIWNMDLQTVTYDDLDKWITEARADGKSASLAKQRRRPTWPCPERNWRRNASLLTTVFCWIRCFAAS